MDQHLGNFTFVNFSSREVFDNMVNNGHTAKVNLKPDVVEVHGGGLSGAYVALQFHFHWGQTSSSHPGSEHLVDGHRYRMEMHVVTLKKGLTVEQAVADPEGIAVLGFLIESSDKVSKSEPWTNLTSHLTADTSATVSLTDAISIHDLIGDVDLTKFYRYNGSLTTPMCNEAVVWTVFVEPIHVHTDLLQLFPSKTKLADVYRPAQDLKGRHVFASPAVQLPAGHLWCYDAHECAHGPEHWYKLPGSVCAGERQSPINIISKDTEHKDLGAFTFKGFDDKHVIVDVLNTGHTVKCVLKEGVVEVSGGGLDYDYSVLQFHFHWGKSTAGSTGSEHLLDSKRFPMELHIVTKRKDLTLDQALKEGDGLAVLGFLVEASGTKSGGGGGGAAEAPSHDESSTQSNTEAWKHLTDTFSHIKTIGSNTSFSAAVSIDDLLGDVDRKSFFRYNGSLTTPSCNEAVVWTVFEHAVKVDHSLMEKFPTDMGYDDVYRPAQKLHSRNVFKSSSGVTLPSGLVLLLASLTSALWD